MGLLDFFKQPDLYDGLERCKAAGGVLLDVREADEFAAGRIPGSVNLPLSEIETAETLLPDHETPIFAYCLRGTRSKQAAGALVRMGYRKVKSIGGITRYKGKLEG